MRGKDNWINSYDYILNQLFKYDYSNKEHLHILKLKIWVLDDEILKEDNLVDNDYDNPLNHRKSLENELTFLDKYIRTKDKKLTRDEDPFSSFIRNRKVTQRDFITKINPDTGKRYEKWQQDYNARPSLLNNTQFYSLYHAYKVKEQNSELLNAADIINKLDNITIDNRKVQQENAILLYQPPNVQEESIKNAAIKEKQKEDVHFVKEMKRAHEELIELILSIKPPLPEPPKNEEEDTPENPGNPEDPETPPPPTIIWEENEIYICNFPTIRVDVGESANHSSHKGIIIEQLGEGGYRFKTKSGIDLVTDIHLPPPDLDEYINTVNPFLDGEVEWTFNNWLYAHWYVETIIPALPVEPEEPGSRNITEPEEPITTTYLKPLDVNKDSFTPQQYIRYIELNKRWTNFNELRERQLANIGTRVQLESMFNATVPDMRPDMQKVFNDRKEEKINITNILKDFCLFNEFK